MAIRTILHADVTKSLYRFSGSKLKRYNELYLPKVLLSQSNQRTFPFFAFFFFRHFLLCHRLASSLLLPPLRPTDRSDRQANVEGRRKFSLFSFQKKVLLNERKNVEEDWRVFLQWIGHHAWHVVCARWENAERDVLIDQKPFIV